MRDKIFGVPLVLFFFMLFVVTPGIVVAIVFQTANQKRFEVIDNRFVETQNKIILMQGEVNRKLDTINEQVVEPRPTPSLIPTKNVQIKPVIDN